MERDVIPAQFAAGLHGLGLLRSWPFLDSDSAAVQLSDLARIASDRTHETLDVLDTSITGTTSPGSTRQTRC
jgi:hypothetical protein